MPLGIAFEHAAARGRAHGPGPLGVRRQPCERPGERLRVAGRHNETLDAVANELAAARHVRHDKGPSARGGFEQRARQSFPAARGDDGGAGLPPEPGDVLGAPEPFDIGLTAPRAKRFNRNRARVFKVGRPAKPQSHRRAARTGQLLRGDENIDALRPDHAPHVSRAHGGERGERRFGITRGIDARAAEDGHAPGIDIRVAGEKSDIVRVFGEEPRARPGERPGDETGQGAMNGGARGRRRCPGKPDARQMQGETAGFRKRENGRGQRDGLESDGVNGVRLFAPQKPPQPEGGQGVAEKTKIAAREIEIDEPRAGGFDDVAFAAHARHHRHPRPFVRERPEQRQKVGGDEPILRREDGDAGRRRGICV